MLEILSETGVIGLLLVADGRRAGLARLALVAARGRATRAVPALALAVTVFPFNTSLAFYSTFWGGVFLLLLALVRRSPVRVAGRCRRPAD